MKTWRRAWSELGLAGQLVGSTLLLLLLVQLAGFSVVRGTIASKARSQIAQELTVGERVWFRLLEQNAERLTQGATLLASDFGFRSAVSSDDLPTIESALENHGQRIGSAITVLLDPMAEVKAVAQSNGTSAINAVTMPVLREVVTELVSVPERRQLALLGQTPFQFVLVPVRAPALVGWVMMGFPIDQALADDMFQLFSVHLAVYTAGEGGSQRLGVSTLPMSEQGALSRLTPSDTEAELMEDTFVLRRFTLPTVRGQVQTVLMRSVSEVVAPFQQLQLVLALITGLGLLLFGVASWRATLRVTEPLRNLLGVTQALQRGEYTVAIAHTERADEVGELARGFDTMRSSIAQQQAEIRHLAYWDRLTGLPNREQFLSALETAIAESRASGQPLAVVTLNLDRFKHVNDVLGYAFGDQLLCAVAERLQGQVQRDGDLVARLGGDEFVILLARSDAHGALALTQRVSQAFEVPLAFDEQTVDISASMGVACWPADAEASDVLMNRSEIAMHAAKAKTSGVLLYSPSLDSASSQTLSLLTDLRHALQHDELRLFLQPKVDVRTGRVVAAEALVRWMHPSRGLVPPLQFIPFAEQTGFVRQLTLWMFEEAARRWSDLQEPGQRLRIAINLSTRDLLDQDFPSRLAALLRQYRLPTEGFCLEITESAIMDDPQRAEATLNKLAAQGFKLSIDDFGTGYSSLAYLKRLPVNELKIDKSFVLAMETDESDAKIVRSTIDLAHNLGLSVVAEGVENETLLQALRELDCDEAQGYHMSKPLPAQEFAAWRAGWHAALATPA